MNAYKKPVSVLVVIHTPALEVLLIERAGHPGYWQSVTGSQEDGETLIDTACREVFEETGIVATPAELHDWQQSVRYEIFPEWRHRYEPGITTNTEHIFSLNIPAARTVCLAPGEHTGQCWLPWQEAAARVFSWSNRDAILALPTRGK